MARTIPVVSLIVIPLLMATVPLLASGTDEGSAAAGDATGGANMALAMIDEEPYIDHIHASPAAYTAATGKPLDTFYEAPMLAALVAEGKLPPVEERIGRDPQVIRPAFEIGQYGGILNDVGSEGDAGQLVEEGQQPMAKWNPPATIFYPNIARTWEVSDDGRVFTLNLRHGMKWSDGEDLDADDFMFFYDAILSNEEINAVTPEPRGRYRAGGELMKLRVIDRYTVEYTFAAPYHNAAESGWARGRSFAPEHHLSKFHLAYNDDAASVAKSEGYETWMDAFAAHHSDRGHSGSRPVAHRFPDLPTTDTWVLKEAKPGVRFWGRNPYYWKVDTAGNQLPYADGVQVLIVENPAEAVPAKAMAGELDWPKNEFMDIADAPAYRRNEASGGYRTHLWPSHGGATALAVVLNYTNKDPVKRALVNDLRFRQALSLSINRQELSDKLFFGESVPWVAPVSPTWTGFEDWMATHYAEYHVDRANALLDEIGLPWDADHTWRLQSDGKPVTIDGSYSSNLQTTADGMELLSRYWTEIGVRMEPKFVQGELWNERGFANLWDAGFGGHGTPEPMARADYPLGLIPPWHYYHCCPKSSYPWGTWYHTFGEQGEVPPPEIQRLFELADLWREAKPGTQEYHDTVHELIKLNVENLYVIGTVSPPPTPMTVNNRVGNVPGEIGYLLMSQVEPYNIDTIYIKS